MDGRGGVGGAKDGAARHQHVRTGGDALRSGGGIHAAIHFQQEFQAAAVFFRLEPAELVEGVNTSTRKTVSLIVSSNSEAIRWIIRSPA